MTTSAAARFAQQFLDPGSWSGWDTPPRGNPASGPYADALARARERSGADESVRTGEGRVDGHRIALVIGEFDFLAGSVGVAAADRLLRAVRRATAERLPLLACPATGGTRMQEGTPAFVGMAPIVAALAAHKAAGLPYLVHLRHPVTGGVLASWGSLGQLTTAEPGALIGFLGPRVYESLYGHAFPKGVQQAENLARLGIIDAVLTPDSLRPWLSDVLHALTPTTPPPADRAKRAQPGAAAASHGAAQPEAAEAGSGGERAERNRAEEAAASRSASAAGGPAQPDDTAATAPGGERAGRGRPGEAAAAGGAAQPEAAEAGSGGGRGEGGETGGLEPARATSPSGVDSLAGGVWRAVMRTRASGRPGLRELLGAAEAVVWLCGTQAGERDEALGVVLARFGGRPCVVVGHDRAGAVAQGQEVGPGGLRAARRGMRLAAELGLPLVTVIDTAGARLSQEAEEGALAGEIARCLQELTTLPVPTLSLLLGQGTGGAALALLPADRVLAAEHAWLAPLPPEGASEILYRTTERAAELAVAQRIGAAELLRDGTVDRILPEPDDADGRDDAAALIRTVSEAVSAELAALSALLGRDPAQRAEQRGRRGAAFVRLDDEM